MYVQGPRVRARIPKFPGVRKRILLPHARKKTKEDQRRGGDGKASSETRVLEATGKGSEGKRQKRRARKRGEKKRKRGKKMLHGAARRGGSRLLITRPSRSLLLPLFLAPFSLPFCRSLSLPLLVPSCFRSTAKVSSPDADSAR